MTVPGGFQIFAPTGIEDVAFWQANNLRHHQQVALGMLGSMQRIAGAIFPVAIVEDIRNLTETSSMHSFGGYTGATAGRTGVMEIHAPDDQSVAVSILRIWSGHLGTGLRQQIRVIAPNPATDLAVISIGATELDDGWGPYHTTHQCRVFIGWQPAPSPPSGPCAAGNIVDTHGINLVCDQAPAGVFWATEPEGYLIPRGKNLCISNWHESGSAGLCNLWGCLIRETKPQPGFTGARV